MSRRESYEQRTEEILLPIAEQCGVTVYNVEYVKEAGENYLRAYIDKEGGVTIDDCEAVSRLLSPKLDEEDYIPEGYILEVSSPGLGRTLKKDRHLQYSIGQDVEVKLFKPINKVKEFEGKLKSFDENVIVIENESGEVTFERKAIAKINLALDF